MGSRPNLQEVLEHIPGVSKAYLNPPESVKMTYPCIRYSLKDIDTKHANDLAYSKKRCYELVLIHEDPNNTVVDEILSLPRVARRAFSPYFLCL